MPRTKNARLACLPASRGQTYTLFKTPVSRRSRQRCRCLVADSIAMEITTGRSIIAIFFVYLLVIFAPSQLSSNHAPALCAPEKHHQLLLFYFMRHLFPFSLVPVLSRIANLPLISSLICSTFCVIQLCLSMHL